MLIVATESAAVFIFCLLLQSTSVMNNTIQINRKSESYEALATALGHVVLKFLTIQVNAILASAALMCLFVCLISEQHMDITIVAIIAWVLHLAVMLTVNIAKGGDRL